MSIAFADKKDPSDDSWWEYDCTGLLNGGTLVAANWTVPAGLTKVAQAINGNVARVRLSGGTAGQSYALTLDITSSTTETFQRTAVVKVKEL